MRRWFYLCSLGLLAAIFSIGSVWPPFLWTLAIIGPIIAVGLVDCFQVRHSIRRNFPVIGNLRYFFELIRPELQQYFVESNQSGRPIPREVRSVVYQRAKGQNQTLPFGTQLDVNLENYEWVNHSITPTATMAENFRVMIGGPDCSKPYSASLFNISAMSYGALSPAAITALNLGAKKGSFYHNTGEGGISPYHRQGGDLVWQLGTGYFGSRNQDGSFSLEAFRTKSQFDEVKMIEIKLSQGAKPGKGGMLPGEKVSREVAEIRMVPEGKSVISPAAHSTFQSPEGLLRWIHQLREASGGKPIGFKLCLGAKSEFLGICKAMLETGIMPDFITVDGGEGGTGAAPLEFSNYVGTPLEDGLSFVVDALRGFNLKRHIKVIASGKAFTSFNVLQRLAMGADVVAGARGMMLSLGCIQALRCNTNECPAGVATTDPGLTKGLHIPTKSERVYRFQKETVHHFIELLAAVGYSTPDQLNRSDVYRRLSDGVVKSYEDLHPTMPEGFLLEPSNWKTLSSDWQRALTMSQPKSFRRNPELAAQA
ncbi:MAG: FMN-binding glutamate synthase family protein [Bdellovibrionales bacterium]